MAPRPVLLGPASDADLLVAVQSLVAPARAAEAVQHDAAWERYRGDLVAFVRECCFTFDTRLNPDGSVIGWVPFDLYPFQVDFVQWLEARYTEHQDGFVEKSRDMGVTWCAVAWLVWHWLFDEVFTALVGSYTEAMVDNFLHESVFGKIEGLITHLPDWMQERCRFEARNPESRKHLAVVNRATGSTINGHSSEPRFSRGGRYSAIVLDEFSKWAFGEQVLQSTADASPFRLFIATPQGMNSSGRLRHADPPKVKVYTLHWRLHPKKDDAWYQNECARRTPEQIAQELDISYERSVAGRVYPEWDRVPSGDFPFVPGWPLQVSWDFGLDDATAMVWSQRNPTNGLYRIVDYHESSGRAITGYLPFVTGEITSGLPYGFTEEELRKIESHQGWGPAVHYGDPSGSQRNQVTGTSVIGELRKLGIYVNTRADRNTFYERWQTTKLWLSRLEGWNRATCTALHDAMVNSRFPERNPDATHLAENDRPIHDWASHGRTAVEYLAVNVHGQDEASAIRRLQPQPSAWMSRGLGQTRTPAPGALGPAQIVRGRFAAR